MNIGQLSVLISPVVNTEITHMNERSLGFSDG